MIRWSVPLQRCTNDGCHHVGRCPLRDGTPRNGGDRTNGAALASERQRALSQSFSGEEGHIGGALRRSWRPLVQRGARLESPFLLEPSVKAAWLSKWSCMWPAVRLVHPPCRWWVVWPGRGVPTLCDVQSEARSLCGAASGSFSRGLTDCFHSFWFKKGGQREEGSEVRGGGSFPGEAGEGQEGWGDVEVPRLRA